MKKKSQMDFVFSELTTKGRVTRNQCLRRYISRLAAYISVMRGMGYKIEGKSVRTKRGNDYEYTLV